MLSMSQFFRPCVRLFVCMFTFELLLKRILVPTSQSRMSNIFGDLESLWKINGKKWSHNYKKVLIMGVKLPRKKKFFSPANLGLKNH